MRGAARQTSRWHAPLLQPGGQRNGCIINLFHGFPFQKDLNDCSSFRKPCSIRQAPGRVVSGSAWLAGLEDPAVSSRRAEFVRPAQRAASRSNFTLGPQIGRARNHRRVEHGQQATKCRQKTLVDRGIARQSRFRDR